MKKSSEKTGVIFTLCSAALWGIYPIMVNVWANKIPPFFFAGVLAIFTALGTAIWMIARKKTKELKIREAYFPLFMVSICIVLIPNLLFFIGASRTSGLNASVLMLSEIIFTLLITPLFGEHNTKEKYLGALGIMIGAGLVLYNQKIIAFNSGDLLIALSTITFPIGNFYSKRALYLLSPSVVIMVRYLLGGIFLLVFAFVFEPIYLFKTAIIDNIWMFIFLGIVILSLCKICFYEGMKRLDISKVISLEMTYPFFSLIVLYLFFDTNIFIHQLIGIIIMMIGGYYAVRRKSLNHNNLKYIPKSKKQK